MAVTAGLIALGSAGCAGAGVACPAAVSDVSADAIGSFPPNEELTRLLQARIDAGCAVGIVVGLIEADGSTRVVAVGSAGEGAQPLGPRSVFEIGSITKVFTGTLLAEMDQRGEVSLIDPVGRLLPPDVRVPSHGDAEIRLVDLATHHSGLPRLPDNMAPQVRSNPYADYSVDQLDRFLAEYRLPREIGGQFEYSNLGMGLLGHALAYRRGASYEVLVRERILDPLAMGNTGVHLDSAMRAWVVKGHDESGDVVPMWDIPTLAGAGALRSDVTDMLLFLDANIGEPQGNLARAMRAAHEQRAAVSDEVSIGLAWLVQRVGGTRIIWHNGGTAGARSFIGFDPDREIGVVVLTNSAHSVDDVGMLLLIPGAAQEASD